MNLLILMLFQAKVTPYINILFNEFHILIGNAIPNRLYFNKMYVSIIKEHIIECPLRESTLVNKLKI